MSEESNNRGRAYEFICLKTLAEEIKKIRPVEIEENSSFFAAEKAWNLIDSELQNILKLSAQTAVIALLDFEPLIIENENDTLTLLIQPDSRGEAGDVRDILIIRSGIKWEIGLSIKHNHFAVKHSRLSRSIDFGQKWYKDKCSDEYWQAVNPIFDYLDECKKSGMLWREMEEKDSKVYVPLLNAFEAEIKNAYLKDKNLPRKLVEYLLGEYDFYKVISVDSQQMTQLQTYNMHGTLNKTAKKQKPKKIVPISTLPTKIVAFDFKTGSSNTLEMYLDNGWQFSFRIHNASTKVESSLKFDIQIIGMPASIITINSYWL